MSDITSSLIVSKLTEILAYQTGVSVSLNMPEISLAWGVPDELLAIQWHV
jgi:hypothetical protein